MDGQTAARLWLLQRVDSQVAEAVQTLLTSLAEQLALATSDAVTMRVLSADGRWLFPLAAYHPDSTLRSALVAAMDQTTQRPDSGLWRPVMEQRRAMRWHLPTGYLPDEASPAQVEFLRRYPLRAVIGAPLLARDGGVLGGVSLTRFAVDRPYTDEDERLLVAFAERAALALELLQRVEALQVDETRPS